MRPNISSEKCGLIIDWDTSIYMLTIRVKTDVTSFSDEPLRYSTRFYIIYAENGELATLIKV